MKFVKKVLVRARDHTDSQMYTRRIDCQTQYDSYRTHVPAIDWIASYKSIKVVLWSIINVYLYGWPRTRALSCTACDFLPRECLGTIVRCNVMSFTITTCYRYHLRFYEQTGYVKTTLHAEAHQWIPFTTVNYRQNTTLTATTIKRLLRDRRLSKVKP